METLNYTLDNTGVINVEALPVEIMPDSETKHNIQIEKKFLERERLILDGRESYMARPGRGPDGEKLDHILVAEPFRPSPVRKALQAATILLGVGGANGAATLFNAPGNVPGMLYGADKKIEQHLPSQYMVQLFKPGETTPYKTEMINLERTLSPFAAEQGDIVKILNPNGTPVKVGSIKMDLLVKGPDGKYATNPVPLAGAGPRAFSADGLDTAVLSTGKNIPFHAVENGKTILESQKGYMFVLGKCPEPVSQNPTAPTMIEIYGDSAVPCPPCNPRTGSTISIGPTYTGKIGADLLVNKRVGKNLQLGLGAFYMPLGKDNIESVLKTDVVNVGYPLEMKTSHMTEVDSNLGGVLANVTLGQKGNLQFIGEAGVGKMMSRHNYAFKQTATNLNTGEIIKENICGNGSENFDKYVYRLGVGLQKMNDCDKFGFAIVGGVILGLPKDYILNSNAVGAIPIELNKHSYKAYVGLRATF